MTAPHLDDDALSALVDGEAPPGDREHLAGCLACQAELAALASVARAVATPVLPPAPSEVDAAIARALSSLEAGPSQPAIPRSAPGDQPPGPSVAPGDDSGDRRPLPVGGASRPSVKGRQGDLAGRRRRGRATSAGPWLVGAGVGAAAAAVLVFSLLSGLGRSASTTSSSTKVANSANGPAASASAGATTSTVAPPRPVTDLGEQSDAAAVARLITAALSSSSSPTLAPLSLSAGGASGAVTFPTAPPGGATSCDDEARAAVGPQASGAAVDHVTLIWRGQPAVAVVFGGSAGRSGAIMSTLSCGLLAVLPF